ncbi:MAG: hypothetical protein HOV81_38135 [Kofleriaceae bacterium]|nr:hypothetical protein [Kofleriaceae bacterium]
MDATQWKPFVEIGLLPNSATQAAQKLVVSTYRMVGLAMLTVVIVVLVGYIAVTAFYFFSRTWVAPVAIAPSDEHVVALQSSLATQLNERERLAGELAQAERSIAAEQSFQLQFIAAIRKDLENRRTALGRAKRLSRSAAATRDEIRETNGDYSASTFERMNDDYAAGMIDRQAMLSGKFVLSQISAANLTLAERQAEYDQRASDLSVQAQSLDAILANRSDSTALSYDILEVARNYENSKLALAREIGNRDRLKTAIARQDEIIGGINQSAYLRALADGAVVALVPYANLGNVHKGTPLYACRLDMIMCRRVGRVLDILPGEVQVSHPTRDLTLRGRMIEMQMSEPSAAQESLLFAGAPPLWF